MFSAEGPLLEASVFAYPDFSSYIKNQPIAHSTAAEKPGQYVLHLPEGHYYLVAHGQIAGEKLFSYHGINPITIKENYRWLPFFLIPEEKVRKAPGFQGISGQVFYKDKPLTQGIVSLYPATDKQFRGMGLLTNSLDEKGRFFFETETGSYVIIARHRRTESDMGPLHKGDLYCYPSANPIEVEQDIESTITVRCYPRDDLSDFLENPEQDPRGRREPQRRHASYWTTTIKGNNLPAGPAILSGTVVDQQNISQANLYVTAYPADNFPLFQMHILRLISPYIVKTDSNGNYRLQMPPGNYYLVAREKIGEAPTEGEHYGLYEGNSNHSVTVDAGRVTEDITITVEPIMP